MLPPHLNRYIPHIKTEELTWQHKSKKDNGLRSGAPALFLRYPRPLAPRRLSHSWARRPTAGPQLPIPRRRRGCATAGRRKLAGGGCQRGRAGRGVGCRGAAVPLRACPAKLPHRPGRPLSPTLPYTGLWVGIAASGNTCCPGHLSPRPAISRVFIYAVFRSSPQPDAALGGRSPRRGRFPALFQRARPLRFINSEGPLTASRPPNRPHSPTPSHSALSLTLRSPSLCLCLCSFPHLPPSTSTSPSPSPSLSLPLPPPLLSLSLSLSLLLPLQQEGGRGEGEGVEKRQGQGQVG